MKLGIFIKMIGVSILMAFLIIGLPDISEWITIMGVAGLLLIAIGLGIEYESRKE